MTIDTLRAQAAPLFAKASSNAIQNPGARNDAFDDLNRLCGKRFSDLGFSCMADCFAAAAPKIDGALSLEAWSSARIEVHGWTVAVKFRPLKGCGLFAHLEIHHDGPLPSVTETGYLSRFIPMATFADMTPDEVLHAVLANVPQVRQLTLF